ncbi:unnamed protein product [Gongylonema pulchrum]|uniref:Transmembrane protein n=1 Tax=Gongylonema pulchrum TaxID=637853 RepID=A0A183D4B4_9BILA|nr:unnamed protein product [Gongylonema pulchrum]
MIHYFCLVIADPIIASSALLDHRHCYNDEAEIERDVDIAVGASDILFQNWSGIYLREELADQMLHVVEQDELFDGTKHEKSNKRHGSLLALSAVIRAHPITIPPLVFKMIPKYCRLGTGADFLTRVSVFYQYLS